MRRILEHALGSLTMTVAGVAQLCSCQVRWQRRISPDMPSPAPMSSRTIPLIGGRSDAPPAVSACCIHWAVMSLLRRGMRGVVMALNRLRFQCRLPPAYGRGTGQRQVGSGAVRRATGLRVPLGGRGFEDALLAGRALLSALGWQCARFPVCAWGQQPPSRRLWPAQADAAARCAIHGD